MAKFINTERKDTIDSLVDGFKERIKNPYYVFQNTQPTLVTYYNINKAKSTLDEGAKIAYSLSGEDCPIRYNKINNFYLYGSNRFANEIDLRDWGVEAEVIEGEFVVLPNTIIPYPNDYFTINYLDRKLLFKVLSSTPDTIENGANFYKITFKLDKVTDIDLEVNIVDEFDMILNNVGTQFNTILRKCEYKFIEEVECILATLKEYYLSLFYSDRVQTFIFNYRGKLFYDPMMIEFLSKHNILKGTERYVFITQHVTLPTTFVLDYDRTFLRCVEKKKMDIDPIIFSTADYINEPLSILSSRKEFYFKLNYSLEHVTTDKYPLPLYDIKLISNLKSNNYDELDDSLNRIIYKYFFNKDLSDEDVDIIKNIEYIPTIELFYLIPVVIYCIESMIEGIMRK